jgi:ubiquinone biosynthesis protein COQ4
MSFQVVSDVPAVPPFRDRVRAALGALCRLMRDPGRLDQVLVFAQAVNAGAVARAVAKVERTEDGRRLFAEMPRIDRQHVDYDALRRLPDGTLGREYVRFLDDNEITPEPFEKLPEVSDPRAAYVMLRMRQTHDLWHVLTAYTTDVRGEVLLQAFTFAQVRVPSAFLLAFLGTLRWVRWTRQHLRDLRDAYRRGKATAPLATFRWEDHWETPVRELRERLHCPA